jgi:hypothetical protein
VPPAIYQAFSLQIFANLKLSFPNHQCSPKNNGGQQQQAPRRRRGAASEAMIANFSS